MSTQYVHFTEEEKNRARMTDIGELLRSHGEKLKRSGSEYEWCDGSRKVTIRGNLWYHQYDCNGGDAIDFVRRFYNKNYPEAVTYLLEGRGGQLVVSKFIEKHPQKPFELPPENNNLRRVFAYLLNHRGIDRNVLYAFVHEKMIYESTQYHNAVFVGYDLNDVARHAHNRGTGSKSSYKGNASGSMPEYSFHWHGTSDKLYLFEAPVDMLSFISMNQNGWHRHNYASACSVSDIVLWQMMKDNSNIKKVCLCLDNDDAGQAASKRIADKLFIKEIPFEVLVPVHKDWNEDLLFSIEQEENKCQVLQL